MQVVPLAEALHFRDESVLEHLPETGVNPLMQLAALRRMGREKNAD